MYIARNHAHLTVYFPAIFNFIYVVQLDFVVLCKYSLCIDSLARRSERLLFVGISDHSIFAETFVNV